MNVNRFGLDLYKKLAGSPDNLLVSPFSIYSVLLLLYGGARGNTACQLAQALHCSPEVTAALEDYRAFLEEYRIKDLGNWFDSANSLWVQEGYALEQAYLKMLAPLEEKLLFEVDFSKSEETAEAVNRWVDDHTRGKIQDILSPQTLSPDLRLILANAAYFKCDWDQKFDAELTSDQPFKTLASPTQIETKSTPLMTLTNPFQYYGDEELQAVELFYSAQVLRKLTDEEKFFGGPDKEDIGEVAFSMVVLLPHRDNGIFDLEKALTADRLEHCIQNMNSREVHLSLPKFKMNCFYELRGVLQALGISDAFDPSQSDLSGITQSEPLFISQVLHQAFVNVDESGTEAAAVTMATTALGEAEEPEKPPEPIIFKADHPFMFLIRHVESGTILFAGRVLDPS